MSEFRQEWPRTGNMQDHLDYIQDGLKVIEQQLVLPEDNRWQIGYGALTMGGKESSVFGEGITSTGKSEWGNVAVGQARRVDIVATDTVGSLEGVESVVTHKNTRPKIVIPDGSDTILFLDEVSHLRDTGPLHKYWTGDEVRLPNGQVLDMRNASIYSTANFYDGMGRSKPLDSAIRARLGINLIAGDGGEAHAKKVSAFVQPELDDAYRDGLLPYAKSRQVIRQAMEASAPLTQEASEFMIDVISNVNSSGLFKPMDLSNKRQHNSWVQAVRARRLVDPEIKVNGPITREDLARVASLGLGSSAILSSVASEAIGDAIGKVDDALTPLEKAIYARRALAGVAMKALIESMDIRLGIDKDQDIANFMNARSYASVLQGHGQSGDAVIVDMLLKPNVANGEISDVSQKPSRRFGIIPRK